jgi:hypothetical protein
MPLELSFKKRKDGGCILTCTREDGTSTWTKTSPPIAEHDLLHFVFETELCYKDAFYGTLAKGYDINAYEDARSKRPKELLTSNLSTNTLCLEHMVNLLQIYLPGNPESMDYKSELKSILMQSRLPYPVELDRSFDLIKDRAWELLDLWKRTEDDGVLRLSFP